LSTVDIELHADLVLAGIKLKISDCRDCMIVGLSRYKWNRFIERTTALHDYNDSWEQRLHSCFSVHWHKP